MSNAKKSPKQGKNSSPTSSAPSSLPKENPSSPGYTPPPPPESLPSSPEIETPTLPPPAMEEKALSGKLNPISKKPADKWEPSPATSPRPPADPVLGGKGLECFVWSAAHDSDQEFLRRFGARVNFMVSFHADAPTAQDAIERLKSLA
jgi:hypothetical protein